MTSSDPAGPASLVPDAVGERTLVDLLAERVDASGGRPWLIYEDRAGAVWEWTYQQFHDDVLRLGRGLTRLGLGKGDRVLVHARNCPEFLLTWFAAASVGAVMVPSNPANTAREIAYIVEQSGAVAAVIEPGAEAVYRAVQDAQPRLATVFVTRCERAPEGWRAFDDLLSAGGPDPSVELASSDVAQILFTSGTTSQAKGVMMTHANQLWSGLRLATAFGLEPTDRCLTALPLIHVNAQSVTVLAALTAGATVILLEEFAPDRYFDQVRRHRATATSLVAAQSTALLRCPPRPDDAEHQLRRCGHAINIPDDQKEAFEKRFGVSFINIYGLSEAAEAVTISPLHGPQRWPSIGLPAIDRRVRLQKADGHDAAVGEVGEILVHGVPGRTIMAGYYDDDAETERVLNDGWLRTGDLGRMDDHGYLYFVDRTKNMIKVSGHNVSTTEVEEVICEHPGVAEAAVIPIPHPTRGEMGKAFVVLEPGAVLTAGEVIEHCSAHLAKFKLPGEVDFLDALPRTSIGKLAKAELMDREARRRSDGPR